MSKSMLKGCWPAVGSQLLPPVHWITPDLIREVLLRGLLKRRPTAQLGPLQSPAKTREERSYIAEHQAHCELLYANSFHHLLSILSSAVDTTIFLAMWHFYRKVMLILSLSISTQKRLKLSWVCDIQLTVRSLLWPLKSFYEANHVSLLVYMHRCLPQM